MFTSLTDIIRSSSAYSNDFFRNSALATEISVEKARILAHNWWIISNEFGKSIACFSGVIVPELERWKSERHHNVLKSILQDVHTIAAHDLGLYEGALNGKRGPFHSDMFATMCNPLGEWPRARTFGETDRLSEFIRDTLRTDLPKGIAVVRLVEGTALEIPKAMRPFFLAIRKDGHRLFTNDTIDYVSHHEVLELEHENSSQNFADLYVETFPTSEQFVRQTLREGCSLFGAFWKKLNEMIF